MFHMDACLEYTQISMRFTYMYIVCMVEVYANQHCYIVLLLKSRNRKCHLSGHQEHICVCHLQGFSYRLPLVHSNAMMHWVLRVDSPYNIIIAAHHAVNNISSGTFILDQWTAIATMHAAIKRYIYSHDHRAPTTLQAATKDTCIHMIVCVQSQLSNPSHS